VTLPLETLRVSCIAFYWNSSEWSSSKPIQLDLLSNNFEKNALVLTINKIVILQHEFVEKSPPSIRPMVEKKELVMGDTNLQLTCDYESSDQQNPEIYWTKANSKELNVRGSFDQSFDLKVHQTI